MQVIEEGYVRINLAVEPLAAGGRLKVEVRDSGEGFDVQQVLAQPLPEQGLSGRGMALVRRLSTVARWTEGGRCAHVEFIW